jgi:TRAP-type C4-dicarboxylate transport system permease large subunit
MSEIRADQNSGTFLVHRRKTGISIEEGFWGTLPYFLSSLAVLLLMILLPDLWLSIPAFFFPGLF